MSTISTTKMSSKGQVVIPENIREQLKLQPGHQFLVLGEGDAIILKIITPPKKDEFVSLLKNAQKRAKEVGLKKEDITKAIKKTRSKK